MNDYHNLSLSIEDLQCLMNEIHDYQRKWKEMKGWI